MAMPEVHFAVGMGAGVLLGLLLALVRRRWLIWLPLVMSVCGGLHCGLRMADGRFAAPKPETRSAKPEVASGAAFHAIALVYLAALCAYAAHISWGIPRRRYADETLARLRRAARAYRPAAVLPGVAPLLLAGGAMAWTVLRAEPSREAAAAQEDLERARWAQLVSRRMGLAPGERLGIIHKVWHSDGAWLRGDLAASLPPVPPGAGAPALGELLERAKANGCDFVAVLATPSDPGEDGHGVTEGAEKRPALINAFAWDAAGERLLGLFPPQWPVADARAAMARWPELGAAPAGLPKPVVLTSRSAEPDEHWDTLVAWRRTSEHFVGFLGLAGAERVSARDARSRWDPRVAEVGGAWDQLLDRGFRLWGAAAASGLAAHQAEGFGPGEFAATHLWSRSRGAADILDALRAGRFWADEGGIVRALDLALVAPSLERPARMGEVARIAPGEEAGVELTLEVPPADFAGRPNQIDEVELVSNFAGAPAVVARFRNLRAAARLQHWLPPARDNNGGLGFYVRARGWRKVSDDARLFFHTNPIHVLVRAGQAAPAAPGAGAQRVASERAPGPPPTPEATTAQPVAAPSRVELAEKLAAIGLPAGVKALRVETFEKPPSPREWRGAHASIIGDPAQGRPAVGDEDLRVECLTPTPLGAATRLFFRCYAADCPRLAIVLRTSLSAAPYQAVRELPEKQWVSFDLSFSEDFLPVRGAGGPLRAPAEVQAIEWTGSRLGPLSRFHVADFVVYEPTAPSRRELARKRATDLLSEVRLAVDAGAPPATKGRASALETRLRALARGLEPTLTLAPPTEEGLDAIERELAELASETRRLGWHAVAARMFGVPDPRFAITAAPPTQRMSSRNPALLPGEKLASSWDLAAAGGEAESLQVAIIALWDKLEGVELTLSDFAPVGGGEGGLPAAAVSAALVDDVEVPPRPTLTPEQSGWVPDRLLPLRPFDLGPGALRCVLLTVHVPPDLAPGDYQGHVTVRARGVEPLRLAVSLRRWDFALPEPRSLPVLAPLDERPLRKQLGQDKPLPQPLRRALYATLLRHCVDPILLLGGGEAADADEAAWCLERGLALAVLHQASSPALALGDAGIARAARCARQLAELGHERRGAVLLPPLPAKGGEPERTVAFARALAREHPELLLVAGGEGEPPGDLITHIWRRPLGADPPRRPRDEEVEVRLSRTARREAWELLPASPDSLLPNLLLTRPLFHSRLLPWLAWQHGVRALVLRGVARWGESDIGDGVLIYPARQPEGGPPRQGPPEGGTTSGAPPGEGRPTSGAPPEGGTANGAAPGEGTKSEWVCPSLRLVALRDGVEDYECLRLLWERARALREQAAERHAALLAEADRLLADAAGGLGSLQRPCREPHALAALRARLGRELERLEAAWWATVDASPELPAPPGELTARPGDGQVALSWARSPDARVASYDVYRSREPKAGFARLNRAPVTGLSYVDRAVESNVAYHYFVRSRRADGREGPRSATVSAAARPVPKVVWGPMPALSAKTRGPYRVALRLQGPGTGGILPLARPQIDYALSGDALDGFQEMTRLEDGSWVCDVPSPDWSRQVGRALRVLVRIVDRDGRVVVPPVEREVPIGE